MWGQIISAVAPTVIGGIMGNKAAKEDRKNMKAMNDANMAGFRQYEPYVDQALSGGQDAFHGVLDTGYYQGPPMLDLTHSRQAQLATWVTWVSTCSAVATT